MRLLSSPATASLAISVGGNTAGLAVRYHDASFASTHHHCRFSACKGRRSVIQAAVMRSEIVKTAAGSRPRPAPWPRGTAPPTRVCFLVRVSLVFRRTQCFAETVWVKAANVAKHSHLGHLNRLVLLKPSASATCAVQLRAPWRRGGGPAAPGRLPRKTCAAHLRGGLLRSSPWLRVLSCCCAVELSGHVKLARVSAG